MCSGLLNNWILGITFRGPTNAQHDVHRRPSLGSLNGSCIAHDCLLKYHPSCAGLAYLLPVNINCATFKTPPVLWVLRLKWQIMSTTKHVLGIGSLP